MAVRIGTVTFTDWVSLSILGGWSDTFIFRISTQACLPPFSYTPLLKHLTRSLRNRSSASLWVQVDSSGEWYVLEVRRALREVPLPHVVTNAGDTPEYLDFSSEPALMYLKPLPPPYVREWPRSVMPEELKCLQALGRMKKGNEYDIAHLTGLSVETTKSLLADLALKKMTVFKTSRRIVRGKSRPVQMDIIPLWHTRPKGVSLALRSWGVPIGTQFRSRVEENLQQIGNKHRHIARAWPAWINAAWPGAEIWTGWSEVRIPGFYIIPDGLAWGRIQGYETLFWLEVGDNHRSMDNIKNITAKRLSQAWELSKRTKTRLVYTQLSTKWVNDAAKWACLNLPQEVAVVLGDWKRFGELPIVEWGSITGI